VELTHDLGVLLPLLIAVVCAHGVTVLLLKRSILTEKVSRRGFHLSREYATDPLEILMVRDVMTSALAAIPANTTQQQVAAAIGGDRRGQSLFSAVDEAGHLVGVVTRWVLEQWAERPVVPGAESPTLEEIAQEPITAFADEPLRVVVNRMAETGRTDLPVVDRQSPRQLVGRITLHEMLKARVHHVEEERRRERPLPIGLIVPRWLRSSPGIPPSGRLPVRDGPARGGSPET